jgi:uncharacterized protein (DUF433 family)
MIVLDSTQSVPLAPTENGTIRVTGSRVSLEAVVGQYEQGSTAEQIQESFPSLRLADIYAVISYYLNHREQVDEYLCEQETKAQALRDNIEADPVYKSKLTELRERIKSRHESQHRSR